MIHRRTFISSAVFLLPIKSNAKQEEFFNVELWSEAIKNLTGNQKQAALALGSLIKKYTTHTQALEEISEFVNRRFIYKTDEENYQRNDYWVSPSELCKKQSGDCEDYALCKYFMALACGIPKKHLKFIYNKGLYAYNDTHYKNHLCLVYSADGSDFTDPIVLDNMIASLRPLSKRPDIKAKYLVDEVSTVSLTGPDITYQLTSSVFRQLPAVIDKARREGFISA
jgi:predicted transglutaminase-like cysteine proteinase